MKLLFVHGWSVTHTDTYGRLPEALAERASAAGLELNINHILLGRYVSFDDSVRMDDIVRAFEQALHDTIPNGDGVDDFSCITHSTGGPVVREWLHRYYGPESGRALTDSPLRHLIMLAPANHGSALAQLGKGTLGRFKSLLEGVQPGQKILDWLELGSRGQRALNLAFLDYKVTETHETSGPFFPCVLAGEKIDRKLYDFVNSYTGEPGSDGVVRVAAANLNFSRLKLVETDDVMIGKQGEARRLELEGGVKRCPPVAFRIIKTASHSGKTYGIMKSVSATNADKKDVVAQIFRVLQISDPQTYEQTKNAFAQETSEIQKPGQRFSMIVFNLVDDQDEPIDDFDLILLAGPSYDPNKLPKRFFRDRQRNRKSHNSITYFVNYDVMMRAGDQPFGFRINARPNEGLAFYFSSEYHSEKTLLRDVLQPNETLYVDIVVKRRVDSHMTTFVPATDPRKPFDDTKPSGDLVTYDRPEST